MKLRCFFLILLVVSLNLIACKSDEEVDPCMFEKYLSDVVISGVAMDKDTLAAGETLELTIAFTNLEELNGECGDLPTRTAEPSVVWVTLEQRASPNDEWVSGQFANARPGSTGTVLSDQGYGINFIGSGREIDISFPVEIFTKGEHRFILDADYDGDIEERDENNNSAISPIFVQL